MIALISPPAISVATHINGPQTTVISRVPDTPPANPEPDRDEWREEQDLQAQRYMALWAGLMLVTTIAGVVITGAGVFYVKHTLAANQLAAKASADSARATLETVRIMRNAERPYLTPINVTLDGFEKQPLAEEDSPSPSHFLDISFDVLNVGPVGAGFIITVEIAVDICRGPGSITAVPDGPKEWPGRYVVAPGQTLNLSREPLHAEAITLAQHKAISNYSKTLFVFGSILYFDMFGTKRRTGFMFDYYPPSKGNAGSFVLSGPNSCWFDREEEG